VTRNVGKRDACFGHSLNSGRLRVRVARVAHRTRRNRHVARLTESAPGVRSIQRVRESTRETITRGAAGVGSKNSPARGGLKKFSARHTAGQPLVRLTRAPRRDWKKPTEGLGPAYSSVLSQGALRRTLRSQPTLTEPYSGRLRRLRRLTCVSPRNFAASIFAYSDSPPNRPLAYFVRLKARSLRRLRCGSALFHA
jgi:hypothetical protein